MATRRPTGSLLFRRHSLSLSTSIKAVNAESPSREEREIRMTQTACRIVTEFGVNVRRYAGERVEEEVMEGSERLVSSSTDREFTQWMREAVGRLDGLVDETTRNRIMRHCGHNCSQEYQEVIQFAKDRFQQSGDLNEFLESESRRRFPGTRLWREGDVIYQVYEPGSFVEPMRCYCCILRNLPSDERISMTYCRCSEGFLKSYWEEVLGRPVRVEILESVVSGGKQCRFAIHLPTVEEPAGAEQKKAPRRQRKKGS